MFIAKEFPINITLFIPDSTVVNDGLHQGSSLEKLI